MKYSALLTDLYELTMMQGYYLLGNNPQVSFDMFFRRNPFSGGYSIFAGLGDLIETLSRFSFDQEAIDYLDSLGIFKKDFLDYLSTFRFSGDLYAMNEGTVIFPGEPIVRVEANLIEAQLIESILLNILNFQTLIATKTARIYNASREGLILEFGLRRAQGWDGAVSASRAAFIGGAAATSNTLAGKLFNIPVKGTMAHSWVMAFPNELESFRSFAETYPDNAILLIDTYDALGSGIENAVIVGKEMKKKGKSIGVRLDSGDLSYLSQKVRKRLDKEGLEDCTITVSNDLTEEIIHQLMSDGAPIDSWGVGTHLVTGGSEASLAGVYKLGAKEVGGKMVPTIKLSNNAEKTTNPGIKQVWRFFDAENMAIADLIALDEEQIAPGRAYRFYHPMYENAHFILDSYDTIKPLLKKQIEKGKVIAPKETLPEIQQRVKDGLSQFDRTYKRIINPHIYKVSLTSALKKLKLHMIEESEEWSPENGK
ncbi:nicotinate phosphoribosyltransferase [Sediminispirochaeta bajacaliforniensis]|uniref:nicotinate phosphoribosyltransferase n=1 Tax=Sediminispirochaeta bajacaliforniensis TaxID=148 RepID=UPI000365520B|nr:nicotinate phosphoribosyltransferase [Sediminispirochaeta bajacaliforniensis]